MATGEECWSAAGWDWTGLPRPTYEGYAYEVSAGLLRTKMADGTTRQRRQFFQRPHTFSLQWKVNTVEMGEVLAAVDTYGYDGVYIPLVTGAGGRMRALDHLIRVTSDIQVTAVSYDLYRVDVSAEMTEYDPACMVAANCLQYTACLDAQFDAGFPQVVVANWAAVAAAWGDNVYWGNPNG